MPARKEKWRRMVTWNRGPRRRARMLCRFEAARLLRDHPGPLMNLLAEVVIDIYPEMRMLRRHREQDQYLMVEYAMRLERAISAGGREFDFYRHKPGDRSQDKDVDPLEIALVAVNVWITLSRRHDRDYTDLEGLQVALRQDGKRIAKGLMRRTRNQALAFGYRLIY